MDQQQFEAKCMPIPESGCLIWLGACTDRYGVYAPQVDRKRTREYAHRLAYRLYVGPIPAGMMVCHKCDVGFCVRPDHLFLGTAADNTRDMMQKGRARFDFHQPSQAGALNSQAKLTQEDANEIRASSLTTRELATCYGVSQSTIRAVRNRERWNS